MKRPLVYDVGAHNGDDTAYYLSMGYRVVAIEANPTLARACTERFQEQVKSGALVVLNIGVGAEVGERRFYINTRETQISSFAPPDMSRDEWVEAIVEMTRLSTIIKHFGDPFFIKIDVEHLDHIVLRDLRDAGVRPPYLSVECQSFSAFEALRELDYQDFKIVVGEKVGSTYRNAAVSTADGSTTEYSFPELSSGPFGEDVIGDWKTDHEALLELTRIGPGWIDVHARHHDIAAILDASDASRHHLERQRIRR